MKKENVTFELISHIGVLSEDNTDYVKEVNSVSWNNKPSMIEVRTWRYRDGEKVPLKGLCFTQSELIKLRDILNRMHFGNDSDRNYEVEHGKTNLITQ